MSTPQLREDWILSANDLDSIQHATYNTLAKQTPAFIRQIVASREKIKKKLPTFFENVNIIYPPSISLEQCSSEITASFKASLFEGKTFVDLTAGFGIDALFFAKKFEQGMIVEQDENLCAIMQHNYFLLQQLNVDIIQSKAETFLSTAKITADLIYIDPARRNLSGYKTVMFEEYEPNIIGLLPTLLSLSNHLLIKSSPLLDITQASLSLPHLKNIYIVSVQNDCKELLFHVEKDYTMDAMIHAVNIHKEQSIFSFTRAEEQNAALKISLPKKYLYEPNASILKAGGFKSFGVKNKLEKLHVNTHLYTSDEYINLLNARCFEIIGRCAVNKKSIEAFIPDGKANLSVRNFPMNTNDLKKKLQIQDGGDVYLFAITNAANQKELLICKKIQSKIG